MSLEQLSRHTLEDGLNLTHLHMDPSALVAEALDPVAAELRELNERIASLTGAETRTARDVIDHVFSNGGKRVRPALFFFAARLVNYKGEHRLPMAAVCEFVHTASLLHDDVIDNSTLRRNKPTANRIWGDEASVLTGDLVYARASEMMADTGSLEIVSMFARAIRLMSEGELLQLEHLYNPKITEIEYFQILENKTAVLLAAACKAPAVLADAPQAECKALEVFGRAVGYAFQLLDDALDYAGTDSAFGKKTLADLPEGKVTLPIMLLRDQATAEEWEKVERLILSSDLSHNDMKWVLSLVDHYDTAGQTLARAESWTNIALQSLNEFPESQAREDLKRLASRLLMRIN